MSRKIAIGDIHGALAALEQLISRLNITATDQLIFLGDYVDGWSQSAQVIDYLLRLQTTHHCIFIKGNHDVWCEEWLKGFPADRNWLFHGGMSTVESYTEYTPEQIATHLHFFDRLKNYYEDNHGRLFIHAGFTSEEGPVKEAEESTYYLDRSMLEMALSMDKRWRKKSTINTRQLALYNEIFIGHTPTTIFKKTTPLQACNVWDIDTGAAFTGKLSAMDIDTKEYWQSDIVQQLYPGEKGRNK